VDCCSYFTDQVTGKTRKFELRFTAYLTEGGGDIPRKLHFFCFKLVSRLVFYFLRTWAW